MHHRLLKRRNPKDKAKSSIPFLRNIYIPLTHNRDIRKHFFVNHNKYMPRGKRNVHVQSTCNVPLLSYQGFETQIFMIRIPQSSQNLSNFI